jgi:carboxynorspermidine decarboxylase
MPRYIIDEAALRRNLEILKDVSNRTGAKILLAQKAFSCAATYPLCAKYLAGTTASSLFEARHGHDNFGGETHVFSPAFDPTEMDELLGLVDHIVFNSPRQVKLHGAAARAKGVSVGLRVNPEVSVATTPAYDPCHPSSRLGTRLEQLQASNLKLKTLDGLHFHCLCEQGVEELCKVLAGFETKFGDLLPQMKWVNFGGGHHITRADYDEDGLVKLLNDFRKRHPHLEVYLEPGEAVALNAGFLEAHVLEIQPSGPDGISNAILDVSAACHMPDVLEMPYTPRITGATIEGTSKTRRFLYRFGGPTCLAGDEIGTYSFAYQLAEGDTLMFEDMAIYSMVKNNTFNGVNLPDIAIRREDGRIETLRTFGYDDFASRLG